MSMKPKPLQAMTTTEALSKLSKIRQARSTDDAYLFVYFSKEEDRYLGEHENMDLGDALVVMEDLKKEFGIEVDI